MEVSGPHMGTEMADMSFNTPFTHDTVSGDDYNWNKLQSTSGPLSLTPSQTTPHYSDHLSFCGSLDPGSFASDANAHVYPCWDRGGTTMPVDCAPGQDTRRTSALLDTKQWTLSPNIFSRSVIPGSQLPLMDMRSDAQDFFNIFASDYAPVANMASMSPVTLHPHPIRSASSGSFRLSSTMYQHGNVYADLSHRLFESSVPRTSPSCSGTTNTTGNLNAVNDQWQLPSVVLYQPPARQGSGRRHSKHTCAINIEGLWIDRDDLYYGAGHKNSTISVHKCLWEATNDPCKMWVVGSRSRVGNHIRKWHGGARPARATAECLWDGCSKTMLKDSVNRHIVSVHFGESFHCQGCDQEFPRQDVYNQHTEDSEACKGVGVALVYGSECRLIDTRQALHLEGMIRYASR